MAVISSLRKGATSLSVRGQGAESDILGDCNAIPSETDPQDADCESAAEATMSPDTTQSDPEGSWTDPDPDPSAPSR